MSQITFKKLQTSNGVNESLDNWVKKHEINQETFESLKNEVSRYIGCMSIRFDEKCMNAEGRYLVFREDGNLYENWDSTVPL